MSFATAIDQVFRTTNDLQQDTEVEVRIGNHRITVDAPPILEGAGAGPNPVELALASLGSCQAIAYRVWAHLRGVQLDKVTVEVDGDLDLRGFFGVEESVRPGFGDVRVRVRLEGPESVVVYRALHADVDRHCPVLDIFKNPVPVAVEVEIGRGTGRET